MLTRIAILVLLVSCSPQPSSALLDERAEHVLQVDMAACRAPDGAPAAWNGDSWGFAGAATLRCGLPIESPDVLRSYTVYGWHPGPGPSGAACLQIRELGGAPEVPPYDAEPCATETGLLPGAVWLVGALPEPGLGISDDFAVSLLVRAQAGDRFGGASVTIWRAR